MKRIEHYRLHYESLDYTHDKDLSFIQIFNQGERFLVNKLAGKLYHESTKLTGSIVIENTLNNPQNLDQ